MRTTSESEIVAVIHTMCDLTRRPVTLKRFPLKGSLTEGPDFAPFCLISLYTYDMRFLDKPITVHMDHVSAALDVDYSPTGKEFVSASFDKTIRIFAKDGGHSRLVRP